MGADDQNTEESADLPLEAFDEREDALGHLSTQMSELSRTEVVPVGFKKDYQEFSSTDVDFTSGDWLHRIASIQVWLNLESKLTLDDNDLMGPAKQLFEGLKGTNSGECLEMEGDLPRLSEEGISVLSARLDKALNHQEKFTDGLDVITREGASRRFFESWDEDIDFGFEAEPIQAKSRVWNIKTFARKAVKGRLNVNPSYQRGDVWGPSNCQQLIVSILRGIPLPSVILMNNEDEQIYEVIDGKQRLTTILRFMGQHPDAIEMARSADSEFPDEDPSFETMLADDYPRFRKRWKFRKQENLSEKIARERYLPFTIPASKLPPALGNFSNKYYSQIKEEELYIGAARTTVFDVFEDESEYGIPLIEYTKATPRQIHEVFALYNQQGKQLNAEEIRNACFHGLRMVRMLLVLSGDHKDFSLSPLIERHGVMDEAEGVGGSLADKKFGIARYARTKVLSWVCALLCQESLKPDGTFAVRSTAKAIWDLFDRIQVKEGRGDSPRLNNEVTLAWLCGLICRALETHTFIDDAWASAFKDGGPGIKWQQLQFVASLLGVALVEAVAANASEILDSRQEEISYFTERTLRPEKSQNDVQWGYIATVALGIVDISGVETDAIGESLQEKLGVNCIHTLQAASVNYDG